MIGLDPDTDDHQRVSTLKAFFNWLEERISAMSAPYPFFFDQSAVVR